MSHYHKWMIFQWLRCEVLHFSCSWQISLDEQLKQKRFSMFFKKTPLNQSQACSAFAAGGESDPTKTERIRDYATPTSDVG